MIVNHARVSQDDAGQWWHHSSYIQKGKKYPRRRKARVETCTECGEDFVTAPTAKNTRCSRSCGAKSVARTGPDNPYWNGGRLREARGYVRVWIPDDDPLVSMRFLGRYVQEHRLIMATAHPCGQRVEDLVQWAHQILDLYEGGNRPTG